MRTRSKRTVFFVAFLAPLLVGAAAQKFPPDMVADSVTTVEGGPTQKGKAWFSGPRVRSETAIGDRKVTTIVDRERGKMWVIPPPPAGCLEQPIPDDPKNPLAWSDFAVEEEDLGTETVDGHPTRKVKTTTKVDGAEQVIVQWRATDLNDFPIRMRSEDGAWETRYENIALRKPDPKLFEPPADCKRVDAASTAGASR